MSPDWSGLLWETRGYLGLDDDAAVPVDELVATAEANGYSEREARRALREADDLERVGDDLDDLRVRLTEEGDSPESARENPEEPDTGGETPTPEAGETTVQNRETPASVGTWREADFSAVEPRTWAPAQIDVDAWMCRTDSKAPYAPWADADAPVECNHGDHDEATTCDACDHHAGYKWGSDGSREHVHADHGTAREWSEMDPSLSSDLAFIQRDADSFAFVDGDDVRDPETGEIHPAFRALLEHLGLTYADVSTSGSGVHAVYRGDIPLDGVSMAMFPIDTEPWGANDDVPEVEIYDGKHVCIATGDHVAGTGTEVAPWDDDALAAVLRANGYEENPEPSADTSVDLENHTPTATSSDETTDDIRDVFAAIDRLDARRVAADMIVHRWNDSASTSGENRAFVPEWGRNASGTANIVDSEIWQDTGGSGYGGVDVIAAVACPDLPSYDERTQPRDLEGADWFRAVEYLRESGFDVPELEDAHTDDEEYGRDPRDLEATVDARRAWDAAGRVSPEETDSDALGAADTDAEAFACPDCGAPVDVVRAVAIDAGLVETCDAALDDAYPEAYAIARDDHGAPLPRYYTEADAIAEFDAVLDVIGEVTFWHLDEDAIASDITARDEEVGGDAIAALNPAWRLSESGESVLVFDSGTVWDADTERVLDALRFVALDSGLLTDATEPLEGEAFTAAYRRARTEYGAPLPRWEPAEDGAREVTPQLPPSEELVDARDLDGVDPDALETAREDVEALIRDATADADDPTVVTALPATGKTTGTVKTAAERPLSYLAPRKELQAQALDKAEKWGVDAEVLPVFSEERVADEVLSSAVAHVREHGKDRLRDRWSILAAATDAAEDTDASADIFDEDDEDDAEAVDLDRATCPTAEGAHGDAWALAVHVARRLGYTPQEIHTQARGLFGAELPCTDDHGDEADACEYGAAWDDVADPDAPADLLVGSYVHAHVDSVRTHFSRDADGNVDHAPRAVVVDEFPGEAYVREFGEEALDHATWLAQALRADVEDRRDMIDADLHGDAWVRAWLDGEGDEDDTVGGAIGALARSGEVLDARDAAAEIREAYDDSDVLRELGVADPLAAFARGEVDASDAYDRLGEAVDAIDPEHPAEPIARWVEDDVVVPLADATLPGAQRADAIDVDALPVGGDLRELVADAVEAVRTEADGARAVLDAATTALQGGREGCRRLAAWANDGYAHPDAHHLLTGVITPTDVDSDDDAARRIHTDAWAFDPDATDGTVLDVVETTGSATAVVDRNDHGALLQTPPSRASLGGEDVPLVGLDATGRASLWSNALGEDVITADIHDTPAERAAFLEDALDLRVLQADDRPRYYEGDPTTKDTDGDVALLEAIAEEYAGIDAPRERGASPTSVGKPAAITTKGVREVLENDTRLDDVVAAWDNYGNVTGANDLGEHRLAAVLGCQHYGDHAIERFAALAGEEVDVDRGRGRGGGLSYDSDLADEYLAHMTEDQTMQAILRFARGDSGATVVARTGALREDLPVVGDAQVVETWSDTATEIARAWRRLGGEFTVADVADAVEVSKRQVRRVLRELVDAGYLRRVSSGDGVASVYEPSSTPGAGEVDLPAREDAVGVEGGRDATKEYYTWNVRVSGGESGRNPAGEPARVSTPGAPPAPGTVDGVEPPG
ncbi:hypothetical protein [Halobellus litoreus]|uniref:Uncharacterized protein n=1 Tax=Halobellus litoreus TaxID=755310 RepID=A0ABD6E0R3_9EURY|nr:hypothetical protein [Halobellus litoreus]